MYVAPITRAPTTRIQVSAASPVARAAAGIPLLAVAALVMAAWFATCAAVTAIAFAGVLLAHGGRALAQAIDYAGQVALGR